KATTASTARPAPAWKCRVARCAWVTRRACRPVPPWSPPPPVTSRTAWATPLTSSWPRPSWPPFPRSSASCRPSRSTWPTRRISTAWLQTSTATCPSTRWPSTARPQPTRRSRSSRPKLPPSRESPAPCGVFFFAPPQPDLRLPAPQATARPDSGPHDSRKDSLSALQPRHWTASPVAAYLSCRPPQWPTSLGRFRALTYFEENMANSAKRRFARIDRLPPYVFNITAELKMAARRRGEDIIDFSMGNPDGATPPHIVEKLVQVAQREDTHGYSTSRGIPR